jgi:S1-C subfamily serine protease
MLLATIRARTCGSLLPPRSGETGKNMKMLCAFVLVIASATAEAADTSAGSGIVIGTKGEILTNSHVVENCENISVQFSSGSSEPATLIARDQRNDLAVIRAKNAPSLVAADFRDGAPVRPGDAVVALGYPLSGLLASTANLSVGNVSALAGLGDDSRYLQISAPVQPGNSGGPLLDASGHLVGIVTAKLNAVRVAKYTGDIPQNVNFALKAEVARTFLDSKGIAYRRAPSEQQLSPADVGDVARPFTVHIECEQTGSRFVMAPPVAGPTKMVEATEKQIWLCNNGTPDLMVKGCTAVLESGPCLRAVVCGSSAIWAFNNRGQAYYRERDYDHAIADFTQVIQHDPNAEVLQLRGRAYSAQGDYDQAFVDWTRATALVHLPNAGAYWLLWNYIESGRADKNEASRTEMNKTLRAGIPVAHLNKEAWPFPVIEFYLGNSSVADMLSAASTPNEQCEAQFYLGEWHLLRHNRVAATAALRIAVNNCPKDFFEYDGAVAELSRFNKKSGNLK